MLRKERLNCDAGQILFKVISSLTRPCTGSFRVLLLDRTAGNEVGWWKDVFGGGARHTDRRMELCDPREPVSLDPIQDKALQMAILGDALRLGGTDPAGGEAVWERLTASGDGDGIRGNPLMLQIASASGDPSGKAFRSRTVLLDEVVRREVETMRERWISLDAPKYSLQELEWLVAAVTLLGRITLDDLFKLLGEDHYFVRHLSTLPKADVHEMLGAALPLDNDFGVSALKPDLVGDLFVLRSEMPPDSVVDLFNMEPRSVGRRLWGMLGEFRADPAAATTLCNWIKGVVTAIESDTLQLDMFLRDKKGEVPPALAGLLARVHAKIAEGLLRGDQTLESLLLPTDRRDRLIPRQLVKVALALETAGQYAEAVEKLTAARTALNAIAAKDPPQELPAAARVAAELDIPYDSTPEALKIVWLALHRCEARCQRALGAPDAALAAIDEAIEFCKQRIESGHIFEGQFLTDPQQQQREEVMVAFGPHLAPVAVEAMTSMQMITDFRFTLAEVVCDRLQHGKLATKEVRSAIAHLEEMLSGDTLYLVRHSARYLKRLADRYTSMELEEQAAVCRQRYASCEQNAAKLYSEGLRLALTLRQSVMLSLQQDIDAAKAEAQAMLRNFVKIANKEDGPQLRHLFDLGTCFMLAYRDGEAPGDFIVAVTRGAKTIEYGGKPDLGLLKDMVGALSRLARDFDAQAAQEFESVVGGKLGGMVARPVC